ncbi:MAG: EAL domain-containing protein [Actinobacteria bacterium]|nr:EAL domain-containing protein [Actinomycetota bacterium]
MIFRPVRKLGLLTKFAILGAIPTLILSVMLGKTLQASISHRAREHARDEAVLFSHLAVEPLISEAGVASTLSATEASKVRSVMARDGGRSGVTGVRIWRRDGELAFTSGRVRHERPVHDSAALGSAFAGRSGWSLVGSGAADLHVFVPLRLGQADQVDAVLEVSMPYAPIAERINEESTELLLILLAGLTLLYAALFRIVAGASNKLRQQVAENEHQALHDALTGLPNRTLFRDRVEQAILAARRGEAHLAVMLMDLDRFKEINDTLGHHNGDFLLQQIGPRLRHCLRESDTIARLGGDEFALLLPNLQDPASATRVAEKIRSALSRPFVLEGLTLSVEGSIGIAFHPDHGTDVDALLQRADVAMYVAKETHNGHEVYATEDDQYSPSRLSLVGDLRRAVGSGELLVYYQPKVDLASGEIDGVEALVRWKHPERGLLAPDEFIPLAEHTELIKPLTYEIIGTAFKQCRSWHDRGHDLSIAVNLSVRSLLDLQFPDDVARLLEEHNVRPGWITFEITESTLMADTWRAMAVLKRLSAMGIGLSIDDYGSGYSSLSYVKRLPISEIKIDKSFVMNMDRDENDAVIVRSTIDLGRNLGLNVVAEGVETEEVWKKLAALGCNMAQGHYLSEPVPADEITQRGGARLLPDRSPSDLPGASVGHRDALAGL